MIASCVQLAPLAATRPWKAQWWMKTVVFVVWKSGKLSVPPDLIVRWSSSRKPTPRVSIFAGCSVSVPS
jgi:hypothetical protein